MEECPRVLANAAPRRCKPGSLTGLVVCGVGSGMRDDKHAELDLDLQSLPVIEVGVLEPSTRELEPRHERRGVATSPRLESRERLISLRLLHGNAAFGELGGWFNIGVSHDQLFG